MTSGGRLWREGLSGGEQKVGCYILSDPLVPGWGREGGMKPICFCLLGQMLLGPEACKPQPLKAWRQRTGLKDPQGWGMGGVRVLRG